MLWWLRRKVCGVELFNNCRTFGIVDADHLVQRHAPYFRRSCPGRPGCRPLIPTSDLLAPLSSATATGPPSGTSHTKHWHFAETGRAHRRACSRVANRLLKSEPRKNEMKILIALLLAPIVVVLGAIGIAYSGLYNVAATEPHSGLVHWIFSTTSHASVERQASKIDVPDLTDESLVKAGVNDFEAMCVGCHGAPGVVPEAMGQGLNPPAPDLAESAAHMSPAELFWVTKNGIKMTGMPAWGATHDDDALWPVVALMTRLAGMDAAAYEALVASAEGMGHHAAGDDHDEHEHGVGEPETTTADQSEPAHDHSTHEHKEKAPEKEEVPHDDGHDHEH